MVKLILLLIIILTAFCGSLGADTGLKSGFDSSGNFNNRLQFDWEIMDLSLLSSVSKDGLEWIEADIFIQPLYIGRIQLKGIIRELSNPDGVSPSASVLTEPSGLRVTDSMSRSSRYGILLEPINDNNLSAWFYRANSGVYSAGILYTRPELVLNSFLRAEAECVLTAGSYREITGSQWFGTSSVFPGQTGINAAAEIRISTEVARYSGRRMLIPPTDDLSFSLSVTAAGTMPQYTVPGGLVRVISAAGNRNLYFSALFQSVSPDYISLSGSPAACGVITGAGVTGAFESGIFSIKGQFDYCLKRRKPEVVPTRYLEQAEIIDGCLELGAALFSLKLRGSCSSVCEISGIEVLDAGVEAGLGVDAGMIRMDIGYGRDCTAVGNIVDWEGPGLDGVLTLTSGIFRFSLGCGYKDRLLSMGGEIRVVAADYIISAKIEFEAAEVTKFAIGFEI